MRIKAIKTFTQRNTEKTERNLSNSLFELTPSPSPPLQGRGSQANSLSLWGRVREGATL